MLKLMKNIVVIGCSILLFMGSVIPANADEGKKAEINEHLQNVLEENSTYEGFMANDDVLSYEELLSLPGTSVRYEIDSLREMEKLSAQELQTMNVHPEDIQEIKSKGAKELVLENAATLPDSVLKEKGVSLQAISAIKSGNFDAVSEADVRRASGKLAFNIASVSRAGNQCNFNVYWHWDVKPTNLKHDYVAANISDNYMMNDQCACLITYVDPNGYIMNKPYRLKIDEITQVGSGVTFTFDMLNATSMGPQYAQAGKAFVSSDGKYSPDNLWAYAHYFHSWTNEGLSLNFNFGIWSFSGNGSEEGSSTVGISK